LFTRAEVEMSREYSEQCVSQQSYKTMLVNEFTDHHNLIIFNHGNKLFSKEKFKHSKCEKEDPHKNNQCSQYPLIHSVLTPLETV
jgi:hypothetical protein